MHTKVLRALNWPEMELQGHDTHVLSTNMAESNFLILRGETNFRHVVAHSIEFTLQRGEGQTEGLEILVWPKDLFFYFLLDKQACMALFR